MLLREDARGKGFVRIAVKNGHDGLSSLWMDLTKTMLARPRPGDGPASPRCCPAGPRPMSGSLSPAGLTPAFPTIFLAFTPYAPALRVLCQFRGWQRMWHCAPSRNFEICSPGDMMRNTSPVAGGSAVHALRQYQEDRHGVGVEHQFSDRGGPRRDPDRKQSPRRRSRLHFQTASAPVDRGRPRRAGLRRGACAHRVRAP